MNFTTIGLDDGLQMAFEGLADVADVVLPHDPPLLVDGALQGLNIAMTDVAGSALNVPPDGEVQGVEVRALWWPEVLRPEVFVHPLLHDLACVGGPPILYEDI